MQIDIQVRIHNTLYLKCNKINFETFFNFLNIS